MKKILLTSLALILLCSCNSEKKQNNKKTRKWQEVIASDASKPIKRHEAAFVKVDDKFYLLGGRGIRPVSIFDTKTQQWTTGEKPPIEFHHFQPVVYQNKVYIIGAMTGKYPGETPVEHIYYYDTNTNTWVKDAEIPQDRRRGSTGNIIKNGLVYVSCGILDGHRSGHKKWLDTYNLETGEWKILPDAPRARDHFQAVEAEGKIYTLAGRLSKAPKATFSETIAEVDVYDIQSNTWSTLKEKIPTQRAGNMAIRYQDAILVLGGESIHQEQAHNQVEALSIKNHTWTTFPPLFQGRHGSGALIFKDEIYIASGCGHRGGSPELTTMEKY
ncbi:Kelch repeat-containing protein [Flavicella sediminum]|uniref:Kelch repeat-containing protein n=1 Tax=Flavicella sediminum TaxID=2585141 RepID=UPI00111DFE24|nr:galactose oxidase [Flavicella sediminum]